MVLRTKLRSVDESCSLIPFSQLPIYYGKQKNNRIFAGDTK